MHTHVRGATVAARPETEGRVMSTIIFFNSAPQGIIALIGCRNHLCAFYDKVYAN